MSYQGAIFDLDGVIVDTAKFHYQAWKKIAEELDITFTLADNERLKGVSRMRSLDILLEIGGKNISPEEKQVLAERKNRSYVEMLKTLTKEDVLPGAEEFLAHLREIGVKTALGSASKNAPFILERLELTKAFDVIIDGNQTAKAKPDPEVFLLGSRGLGIPAEKCVVFEDSAAGIEAARRGKMYAVGIGKKRNLPLADYVISDLQEQDAILTLFT